MTATQLELPGVPWTYHRGLPDLASSPYLHLVRSVLDPPETKARGCPNGVASRAPRRKSDGAGEDWCARLLALFADGEARTFNTACVQLTGMTADRWYRTPVDAALWSLVEDGSLAWACEMGSVFFVAASAVTW